MLKECSEIFLKDFAGSFERILYPATIIEVRDDLYIVEFEEPHFRPEVEQNVFIFFEYSRNFYQQLTTILEINETEEGNRQIVLRTVGEAVSAEHRQFYRISTVISEIHAKIGSESECRVSDISIEGVSFISKKKYPMGQTLIVSVFSEMTKISGRMCIQNIRELDNDLVRYGLRVIEEQGTMNELENGLREISTHIEREQLNRLAGVN